MSVATVATVASVAASVAGTAISATSAGGAADSQRQAAGAADQLLSEAGTSSEELIRQGGKEALDAYKKALEGLSPYEQVGKEGRNLLGRYLGIEGLYSTPDVSGDPQLKALASQRALMAERLTKPFINPNRDKEMAAISARLKKPFTDPNAKLKLQDKLAEIKNPLKVAKARLASIDAQIASRRGSLEVSARESVIAPERGREDFGTSLKPFTLEDFQKEPGYEFRRAEGQRGLTNLYGSQGGLLSGNALRGLDEFNQEFASEEFGKAYDRDRELKLRRYGIASDLTGTGERATTNRISGAGNIAEMIQNTAQGRAGIRRDTARDRAGISQDVGNIGAAERVAKAQAYSDLVGGIAGAGESYANRDMLSKLFRKG